jgi:TatD DNase family protein
VQDFESVYGALGIQPHDAKEFTTQVGDEILSKIKDNKKICAIGEIGLDYHYNLSPRDLQNKCFEYFVNASCQFKLPIVVHMRESFQDIYSTLKKYQNSSKLTGVIHCFTGTLEEAFKFLDLGFYISFSGIITFKSAGDLRTVVKNIPLEKLLIETDSPYLAPVPKRGKTNEPANLKFTLEKVLELRSEKNNDVIEALYENSLRLFQIK